ncbi:MAG: enolase C-terminal domain-like protein, partial [Planctomycetaceae bacterium]
IGVGRGCDPTGDLERVALARRAIGPEVELFVDANGAYPRKRAIRVGRSLAEEGVTWFEEPVTSDDVDGLREVRSAVQMDVAAGEYAYDAYGFARLLPSVDVLQADVTRCAGITGWMRATALAASHGLDVSGHTAQSLHLHVAAAAPNLRHLEYFVDHERTDRLLFDGVPEPIGGELRPDPAVPGHGLSLKRSDAERYREA